MFAGVVLYFWVAESSDGAVGAVRRGEKLGNRWRDSWNACEITLGAGDPPLLRDCVGGFCRPSRVLCQFVALPCVFFGGLAPTLEAASSCLHWRVLSTLSCSLPLCCTFLCVFWETSPDAGGPPDRVIPSSFRVCAVLLLFKAKSPLGVTSPGRAHLSSFSRRKKNAKQMFSCDLPGCQQAAGHFKKKGKNAWQR